MPLRNGNGLCSLAECETYMLKKLLVKFPKTGKGKDTLEPGKDIWSAFRPCYIRAFKDAADFGVDTGAVIKGTKDATNDDFVTIDEFRVFNAYVCVYATMFDAFAKIDGGGAGRDANDDGRLEMGEWVKGYKNVGPFGFVAFRGIYDMKKKQAKEIFAAIDDNGGGIFLLDEFCTYIKEKEIAEDTTLGKCLNEEAPAPDREKLEAMQKEAEEKEAARIRKRDTPIMTTSFGLSICRGASKELLQFIEVFAPMAEKTEEAEEAREEGFVLADP